MSERSTPTIELQLLETRHAFDSVAADYDGPRGNNLLIQRMRRALWNVVRDEFPSESRLLDLGCGTGLDAVEFAQRGVSGVYTLWRPSGWHGPHTLGFGTSVLAVHRLTSASRTIRCGAYDALVRDSGRARTAYHVFEGRLWGFGLFGRGTSPCR